MNMSVLNRRNDTLIVIYNVIKQSLNSNQYETIPMTFIVRKDQIITITNHHNEYIVQAMKEELKERPDMSLFTFLFSSLFMITEYYFPKIERLKKEQGLLSQMLRQKQQKKICLLYRIWKFVVCIWFHLLNKMRLYWSN